MSDRPDPSEKDVLLGMFLRNYKRDMDDGITIRSLHGKIDEHADEDRRLFDELRNEQREQGERVAAIEATTSHLREKDVQTGRFIVPTPPAMSPMSPIHIDINGRRNSTGPREAKRDSKNPLAVLTSTTFIAIAKKVGPVIAAALVSWAIGHFVTTPAPPNPQVISIPVAAPVSDPMPTVAPPPPLPPPPAPSSSERAGKH